MNVLDNLKYTREHEWIRVDGDIAYIGVTDYAQRALGDIVFVELPPIGAEYNAEEPFAAIESVKAASDIYIPVSGTIVEINQELEIEPFIINTDAYGSWIAAVKLSDPSELDRLLSAEEYKILCAEED